MDQKQFVKPFPGKLLRIEEPLKDWAFLPDELPPAWEIDNKLWPLLVEARAALGTLNGIGQTLPDPRLLLSPLQNREAITSSSIEGTYVTAEELLLFALEPREPAVADEKQADWLEVYNYRVALEHGQEMLSKIPLCNRLILGMHEKLMHGVRGRNKSPGKFRQCAVQIGSKGRFIPPPWGEVARLMKNLEQYMNRSDDSLDPLIRSFIVHYQFETIHPFRDGNGRVGRALLSLMIQNWLGHSMPWLYLSAYFEQYRDEYIERLFKISTKGEWLEWIEFCLRATVVQAKDSIARCHAFKKLHREFNTRVKTHSPRTFPIIESLFSSPIVTITSIADQFQVVHKTAQADLQRLVDAGILKELHNKRPRSFYSPEIMAIAYDNDQTE